MRDVPVGQHVVFYPHGDVNAPPVAAIVTASLGNTAVELATFPRMSQTIVHRRNVLHVNNELLEENENIRRNYGAWETVEKAFERAQRVNAKSQEAMKKIESPAATPRADDLTEDEKSKIEVILNLHGQGYKPDDIAQKLHAKGWTAQRVMRVIRNNAAAAKLAG